MARIRTVKPELFEHEELFDLEKATGLPLRLAFIGLFTCCDREGRFKWRPRALKKNVLPYDDHIDFSRVLDALGTRGFVRKYVVDGEEYGVIPTWDKHQVINNRESESDLPYPEENSYVSITSTREARVGDATGTRHEGKGREGKGKEEEGKEGCAGAAPPGAPQLPVVVRPKAPKEPAPTSMIWQAYAQAYLHRYRVEPVRNAKVNGQLSQLLQRLGAEEAPAVAAWFVGHNLRWYVQKMHAVDCLLSDCEKLRTEWATGKRVTAAAAQQADRLQETGDMWGRIMDEQEMQGA